VRNWIQLLTENNEFQELDNIQTISDNMGMGFYWEEGGCWGMALAILQYFTDKGIPAKLCIQDGYTHCFIEAAGKLYDYTGEIFSHPKYHVISKAELFSLAEVGGFSKDEVVADMHAAMEIINN
jgi:hypothetical protein